MARQLLTFVACNHVVIHLRHVAVTVNLYLHIRKEAMCVWRFESSVWKRLEALLLKALYQMWSQSFLVESHFAQVISSCGMVGEGYCKHSPLGGPTLPVRWGPLCV